MTERDWLNAMDPQLMLEWLRRTRKGSHRKLRLFMVACCRRVWHTFAGDEHRTAAVLVAERHADGVATNDELHAVFDDLSDYEPHRIFEECTTAVVADFADECAVYTSQNAIEAAVAEESDADADEVGQREAIAQADFLRDIFGPLPFHPVAIDPSVFRWNDGTVRRLAETLYEERELPGGILNTDRLVVLADALEEAGCHDEDILRHCRGPGPHVKGCWVVDLLLGKD